MSYRTAKIFGQFSSSSSEEYLYLDIKQEILNQKTLDKNKDGIIFEKTKENSYDIINSTQIGDIFSLVSDNDLQKYFQFHTLEELNKIFNRLNIYEARILIYNNRTLFQILQKIHLKNSHRKEYENFMGSDGGCCC